MKTKILSIFTGMVLVSGVSAYAQDNCEMPQNGVDNVSCIFRENKSSATGCFAGLASDLESLDSGCFEISGSEAVLISSKCGFMTSDTDSTCKAITIGSPMREAIHKPLFVRFSGLSDSKILVRNGLDVFKVVRNLFVNRDANMAGYVEFSGKSEDGQVEGIRIFVEKYENYDYEVDYTRPVLFCSIFDDEESGPHSSSNIDSYRRYNSKGQITEYYCTEILSDSPTMHHLYKVDYSDSIPVVKSKWKSDCSIFDIREDPGEFQAGATSYEQFLEMTAPEKFDSVEKDAQGRIASSKIRKDMDGGEFQQWDATYTYKDDYCIKNVKYSYKISEWSEDSEEPALTEGASSYKEKIYYEHIRE